MQYRITLTAGVPKRQDMAGKTFVLLETGVATSLDVTLEGVGGFASERLRGVRRGLTLNAAAGFSSATFTATVDCTIEVVASEANITVQYQDGNAVNATIVGTPAVSISGQPVKVDTESRVVLVQQAAPLAVVPDRGAPGNPQYVTGITYSDAPAVTLQDNAAIAVTSAGAALVAANANRRGLRFTNIGTDPVALGFTGITWAKRCLILSAGDTYIEDRAANLAWAAICDATKTASVTVQEVIA